MLDNWTRQLPFWCHVQISWLTLLGMLYISSSYLSQVMKWCNNLRLTLGPVRLSPESQYRPSEMIFNLTYSDPKAFIPLNYSISISLTRWCSWAQRYGSWNSKTRSSGFQSVMGSQYQKVIPILCFHNALLPPNDYNKQALDSTWLFWSMIILCYTKITEGDIDYTNSGFEISS